MGRILIMKQLFGVGKLHYWYKAFQIIMLGFAIPAFAMAGCSREGGRIAKNQTLEMEKAKEGIQEEKPLGMEKAKEETRFEKGKQEEKLPEESLQAEETLSFTDSGVEEGKQEQPEPLITEMDWSNYFDGINGAAVIYDSVEGDYQIYNPELAKTRRSPCSTFKIISSLIALEKGIIQADRSTRTWSGEIFWNEDWNRDIDFTDAFQASCVWYFRQVVDEIGKDVMQEELARLAYGNCDISDWEGRLNTNNNNPALTGFWIESSLLVSPKEQVEVMERIFGSGTSYLEETLHQLKQAMLLLEQQEAGSSVYGKTGMGKANGVVVDAWFTGFAEAADKRISFCVYLGETENKEVSSVKAKEIALQIVSGYLR